MKQMDSILGAIPRILSSHWHVIGLTGLLVWLVILPLFGIHVSAHMELIGGNYTNVTSDIGACIAAGGTVQLVKHNRRHTISLSLLQEEIAKLRREANEHRIVRGTGTNDSPANGANGGNNGQEVVSGNNEA